MTKERRLCACRLTIEAEPDPRSIEHAVSVHQRQPEHRAWWEAARLEAEKTCGPDVQLGEASMFYMHTPREYAKSPATNAVRPPIMRSAYSTHDRRPFSMVLTNGQPSSPECGQ